MPEIQKKFPGCSLSLLTHEHGKSLAQKYTCICNIYIYPYKDGFGLMRPVPGFAGKTFDAVIIPVSNLTGAGFGNVLTFALRLRAGEKYICNLVSEISRISNKKIIANCIMRGIYKTAAGIVTSALCAVGCAIAPVAALVYFARKLRSFSNING